VQRTKPRWSERRVALHDDVLTDASKRLQPARSVVDRRSEERDLTRIQPQYGVQVD